LHVTAPIGKDRSEAILDSATRTAFAFNPSPNAPITTALARASVVQLYNDRQHSGPKHLLAEIPTSKKYGEHGAEALAWMMIAGEEYLLSVGRYKTRRSPAATVTHQVERWPMPSNLKRDATKPPRKIWRGSKFNELIGLQASARTISPLDAPWLQVGDTDRYRYVVIQDGGHRLVLIQLSRGYTKTTDGRFLPDSFFALQARPNTIAQLRITADGDYACLWPSGDIAPQTFYSDGRVDDGCALPRPTGSRAWPVAVHRADDTVQIAPATEPLDFPGSRMQAYTRSVRGDALFVALAPPPDNSSAPVELRRYRLRADRWAAEGPPTHISGQVIALALFGNERLGVAARTDTTSGSTYSVALHGIDMAPPLLPLKVFHFAPVADSPLDYTLCLDMADPLQALALYQGDGPQVDLGAPAAGPREREATQTKDRYRAKVMASVPDPDCAAAPASAGMARYRMTVKLPFAMDGAAKLALIGERTKYYIVNFNRPRLHVLAIGINNYEDSRWRLNYAVNDANAFAGLIKDTQVQLYENIDVTLITDRKATRSRILVELAELQRKAKSNDWVVIFFAGHAQADTLYNYYFLPWDYNNTYPHAVQISENDLATHLRGIKGKKLLVLDTCFAGNLASRTAMRLRSGDNLGGRLPLASVRTYAERLMALDDGLVLLAASSLDQTAREADSLGHGVFTSTLLDALRKPEQFGNRQYPGALSLADIQGWVEDEVVRRSRDRQRPIITGRTDLLRAPFWQVSTTSYRGPADPKTRSGAAEDKPAGFGRVLWHGQSAVVPGQRRHLAAQPLKPASQNAL
jgi:hypothetical protein